MGGSLGAVYLVDRDPRFLAMVRVSLAGLRAHDPDLPVVVLLVDGAGGRPDRDPAIAGLRALAAEVRLVPPLHTHSGYFPDNKAHLTSTGFDRVVYLDADTFVFGSVRALAERYRDYDVAARPNDWVSRSGYRAAFAPDLLCLLNSGVLVAGAPFLDAWADWARTRPRALLDDPARRDLVRWMYAMSPKAYHREEVAFSELAWSGCWSVGILADADCHLLERYPDHEDPAHWRRSTVLHTYSREWDACARRLAAG